MADFRRMRNERRRTRDPAVGCKVIPAFHLRRLLLRAFFALPFAVASTDLPFWTISPPSPAGNGPWMFGSCEPQGWALSDGTFVFELRTRSPAGRGPGLAQRPRYLATPIRGIVNNYNELYVVTIESIDIIFHRVFSLPDRSHENGMDTI